MKTSLFLLTAFLAGLLPPPVYAARDGTPKNRKSEDKAAPLEFPLILHSERAELFKKAPAIPRHRTVTLFGENMLYSMITRRSVGLLVQPARLDLEPFGAHFDGNPRNHSDNILAITPVKDLQTMQAIDPRTVPFSNLGLWLAAFVRKNVLVSARMEYRRASTPGWPERRWTEADFIRLVIEPNGGKVVALGDDTYAVLEAPGHELAFTLGPSRPLQYEHEREAWMSEHPYYSAQGLIYQPTLEFPLDSSALTAKNTKVRHAAAALAKLTRKEVFVQASVEKRDFSFAPWRITAAEGEIRSLIEQQLEHATVKVVELDANCLALVQQ